MASWSPVENHAGMCRGPIPHRRRHKTLMRMLRPWRVTSCSRVDRRTGDTRHPSAPQCPPSSHTSSNPAQYVTMTVASRGCRPALYEAASHRSSGSRPIHTVRSAHMRSLVLRTATIAGAIAVAACIEKAPVSPTSNTITASANSNSSLQLSGALSNARSYIIDFTGNDVPADLSAQVAMAGGTLTSSIGQVGVAVASSDDPSFADRAGKIKGVFSVELDPMVQWVEPTRVVEAGEVGPDVSVEPMASFGAAETFRRAQWVPDAISAPAAWDAGATGAGVRVAILDGGIRSTHIDIAPELDVARSRSFVP